MENSIYGLHIADIAALVMYLFIVAGIGFWAARRVKRLGDFVMPHRFGRFAMTMFSFGAGTHSDQAVSVASKSYTSGLSGIWYQWFWLFATPFYWLMAPIMRRFRAMTVSDIFALRFDGKVAILYTINGILYVSMSIGVMLKGSSAIIEACTGGEFPADFAIVVMTLLFLLYGICGGLVAAIYTDLIQGILTVVFSFILLPSILNAIGGMDGLRENLSPEMLSLTMPGDISMFYIIIISLCGLIGIAVQPHILGVCSAGKAEMDGRFGFVSGNLLKRLCTVAWCLTGLAAVVHYSGGVVEEPDQIYGIVAYEFLPNVMPGLVGVFIAALLASVMSTCDAFMISGSGMFTNNIYKVLYPGRENGHYVKVVRFSSLGVVLLGIIFAYLLPDVIKGLQIIWKIPAVIGISFWLGFFWKRFNANGAWAATITAAAVALILEQSWGAKMLQGISEGFVSKNGDGEIITYLPWHMLLFLIFGCLAGIIASLLSKPTDPEQLTCYYDLVHTPVVENEEDAKNPCQLPSNVTPRAHSCFSLPFNIHIPIPNKVTVFGFLVVWGIVAGLIGGLAWLIGV